MSKIIFLQIDFIWFLYLLSLDLVPSGRCRPSQDWVCGRASANMLIWWAIAHAVAAIAHPVTGIFWILPTQ